MKQDETTLVVLAAGMGTRYGGLKQLEGVGPAGETILDYSVFDAVEGGFKSIVFIVRSEIEEEFRERIGSRFEGRIEVSCAIQEADGFPDSFQIPDGRKKPWGTGHAVLSVAALVDGPFAVINADDFYGRSSFRILHDFLALLDSEPGCENLEEYAMVGFSLKNTLSSHGSVARGVCQQDNRGYLEKIEELKGIESTDEGIVNTEAGKGRKFSGFETVSLNMWGFTPSIFGHLRSGFEEFLNLRGMDSEAEYYLPECVGRAVDKGIAKVKILETSETWMGITYRDDRNQVREHLQELVARGVYSKRLWDG